MPYGNPSSPHSVGYASRDLIETAKHNGLNLNDYLLKIFEQTPLIKSEERKTLLPRNITDQIKTF